MGFIVLEFWYIAMDGGRFVMGNAEMSPEEKPRKVKLFTMYKVRLTYYYKGWFVGMSVFE